MRFWISLCKNCNKDFKNSSGYQKKSSTYCSSECKKNFNYKKRVERGLVKEYNSRPDVVKRKTQWARDHKESAYRWRKLHPDKAKESSRKSAFRRQGYTDEFFYLKPLIKERDTFKCVNCGEYRLEKLIVHHKDGDKKNNNIDNLETLCKRCHGLKHRDNLIKNRWIFGRIKKSI